MKLIREEIVNKVKYGELEGYKIELENGAIRWYEKSYTLNYRRSDIIG